MRPNPFPKLTLTVESLNSKGAGVARHEGKVYFIPWAVPGDEVLVQVETQNSNYNEARVLEILRKSPDRMAPACPYFFKCGGCQLQHMSYAAQLQAKQAIVVNALKRVGHMSDPPVREVIPSPKEWNYRSRIQLHTDRAGRLGFFKPSSHEVAEIERCPISDEGLNEQIQALHRKEKHTPLQTIELRTDASSVFSQVNLEQNQNLIRVVLEYLNPQKTDAVFDLFAGSGNLTFPIAERAKKVWAIEKNGAAVEEGMKRSEGMENILWKEASVLRGLSELKRQGIACDAIVADPPRRGLAEAIEGILLFKPKKIVYVSCDPATFARDAARLIKAGYKLTSCQPLDMFPQTVHLEVVGCFNSPFPVTVISDKASKGCFE